MRVIGAAASEAKAGSCLFAPPDAAPGPTPGRPARHRRRGERRRRPVTGLRPVASGDGVAEHAVEHARRDGDATRSRPRRLARLARPPTVPQPLPLYLEHLLRDGRRHDGAREHLVGLHRVVRLVPQQVHQEARVQGDAHLGGQRVEINLPRPHPDDVKALVGVPRLRDDSRAVPVVRLVVRLVPVRERDDGHPERAPVQRLRYLLRDDERGERRHRRPRDDAAGPRESAALDLQQRGEDAHHREVHPREMLVRPAVQSVALVPRGREHHRGVEQRDGHHLRLGALVQDNLQQRPRERRDGAEDDGDLQEEGVSLNLGVELLTPPPPGSSTRPRRHRDDGCAGARR
mmetsp:Transcript_10556/g.41203  ORF Transcript_10556/g.41203 Transcript_10556/m.41203 type:complete len:346 (-) Transcript_10556:182-1219(-)